MRLYLLTLALIPTLGLSQAPSWLWARSFPASGYLGAASSLAHDSGYYLSLDQPDIMLPWGQVESSTAILLHMNALGEPTTAVPMPPIMRMLPSGENDARFLIAYRDSCVLPDVTLFSSAGIGVAMGVVDGEGFISEVVNLPDLIVGADCAIEDVDLAPNGDLLLAGWFRGTVQCSDSTFFEDGYFLCRYSSTGQLMSAVTIPSPTMSWMPIVRLESDGAGGAYVAIMPESTFGEGNVLTSFNADWGIRWSHSMEANGMYATGPMYLAKAQDDGLYVAYTSAPSAFSPGRVTALAFHSDGTQRWMNNTFGPQFESGISSVHGIAFSPAFGGPVISIYAYGQMEGYGPYPITTNGTPNAVVAGLDSAGQWAWAISDNGPGNVFGTQAVVSPNGTIYASGNFEFGAGLGTHPLTYTYPVSLFAGRIGLGIGPSGIETSSTKHDIVLYPNPATDLVWMQPGAAIGSQVQLRDLQGREMGSYLIDRTPFPINVAGMSSGVYLVCVEGRCQRIVVE
jgi:hypothetical protein